jgi:hypothetical protein
MIKMGGIICDQCRIVIAATYTDLWKQCFKTTSEGQNKLIVTDAVLSRRTKNGGIIHWCSEKCRHQMDGPKDPSPQGEV